jgi:hypothetical protein
MHPERRPDPEGSPESLKARLRALPQPPVPVDLEARLLATIPAEMPIPQRRWAIWLGVVGPLAAACLLAVLAWLGRDSKNPIPIPGPPKVVREIPRRPTDDSARIVPSLQARRELEGVDTLTFTWPIEEASPMRVSTSISPNLLD